MDFVNKRLLIHCNKSLKTCHVFSSSRTPTRTISSAKIFFSSSSNPKTVYLKSSKSPNRSSPNVSLSSRSLLKCSANAYFSLSGKAFNSSCSPSQSSHMKSMIYSAFSNPRPAFDFYFLLTALNPNSLSASSSIFFYVFIIINGTAIFFSFLFKNYNF